MVDEAKRAPRGKVKSQAWKDSYAVAETFQDVKYAYACTIHKSQGSTYRNVYMDFNDVLNLKLASDKEKCQSLYVIITRASHNLYLLDI